MKNLPIKTCPVCKKEFTPTRQWQIYCNSKCQQKNFNSKRNEYLGNLITKSNSLEIENINLKILVEKLKAENEKLKAENKKLKDECNRLHRILQIKYSHLI